MSITRIDDVVVPLGEAGDDLALAAQAHERAFPPEELRDREAQERALADLLARVPAVGEVLARARAIVDDAGAVILRGLPLEHDSVLIAVAGRFGHVTVNRPDWPLIDDIAPRDDGSRQSPSANRGHLTPHTDSSAIERPEDFLFLGCLFNSDPAGGGESILVFVDEVIEKLPEDDLSLLEESTFPTVQPHEPGKVPATIAVLGRRRDGRYTIRYRAEALEAGLESPLAEVTPSERHRTALRRLIATVENGGVQRHTRLEAGDLMVVDNARAMHGRTAISPGVRRHLKRCYAMRTVATELAEAR
jgi:alpha-ketoglutarate-dependent taurine dioxygenase